MSKAEEERSKKEGCCFSPSKLKSMLPTRDGNLAKVLAYREVYLLWATRFGMVLISQGLAGFYKVRRKALRLHPGGVRRTPQRFLLFSF